MLLGVDLPELLGLFPCDRIPSTGFCIRNLFRSSSVSVGLDGDAVVFSSRPVGVEVRIDDSLYSVMFRGFIGEIGSFVSMSDVLRVLPSGLGWKNVESPDALGARVLLNLLGVEYKSSTLIPLTLAVRRF